ncbi:MAG: AAA family ATPase [Planctomycetota bacterium]|jgi:predicted ATPase
MIDSVEVDGYRLLDEFKADIGQLTVVIGANATGKSTFIDCLQCIARAAHFSLNDVLTWEGGLPSVLSAFKKTNRLRWLLTFHKPAPHERWGKIPLKDDVNYVYEVAIEQGPYDLPIPDYEVVRTEKPYGGHEEPFKYLEATQERCLIYNYARKLLVPFDEAGEYEEPLDLFNTAEQRQVHKPDVGTDRPGEVSDKDRSLRLALMRFFNDYPALSWMRLLMSGWKFYPGFEVGPYANLRVKAAEIRPETALAANGENLGTVLHEILTRAAYAPSATEFRNFLQVAYPSFVDIYAETALGTPASVLVQVREKGMLRQMALWDLSDGMLRFLCLGAALLNPVPPPFIAIDEPEAGLHPRLLPIVADMVKTASERTQVLVTTHSPDFLNCFDIDSVAVMARERNKVEWLRPGTRSSLKQMLQNVTGDSLGDLHRSGELEAL